MKWEIKLSYGLQDSQSFRRSHLGKQIRPVLLEKLKLQESHGEWSGEAQSPEAAARELSEVLRLLAQPPKKTAGNLKSLKLSITASL